MQFESYIPLHIPLHMVTDVKDKVPDIHDIGMNNFKIYIFLHLVKINVESLGNFILFKNIFHTITRKYNSK